MLKLLNALQTLTLLALVIVGVSTYSFSANQAYAGNHENRPSNSASPDLASPGQETCPEASPWVKIDGLSSLSYAYTAPEGMLITQICYKASTEVVYEDVEPPVAQITINSNVFNSPGGVTCTANGVPHEGCSKQNLSHASFELALDPGPSNSPSASPSTSPSASPSTSPSASPSTSPSASPSTSPSASPSTSPSSSPSSNPSSTPTPSDNNSSNDGGSVQGDSTGAPAGEVLGTYAATGVVQDVIMNALGSVGGLMTMAGSVLYGKKSKKRA